MNPIPSEVISSIQTQVEANRDSCEEVADKALYPLFLMGAELDPVPEFPLIVSNGVVVYPTPAPWKYAPPMRQVGGNQKINTQELLNYLNGAPATEHRGPQPGLLNHVKENCEEYNKALANNDRPTAERIAAQSVSDSAAVWNNCSALAMSVETGSVYKNLSLSEQTINAYEALSTTGSISKETT